MQESQTIAQVAAASGLSAATLRFYEAEGIIPPVPRDGSGNRCYGEYEISRVNTIRCLRAAGLSLPDMKRYFAMVDEGEETLRERRKLMLETKERLSNQLEELQRCMCYLSLKLEHYDRVIDALAHGKTPPTFSVSQLNHCFRNP